MKKATKKPITQKIRCMTLTVQIKDNKGNPVADCDANFAIHGGYQTDWWPLGPAGLASKNIYETAITCYVMVRGPRFETLHKFDAGISTDTTVVFVLQPCSK